MRLHHFISLFLLVVSVFSKTLTKSVPESTLSAKNDLQPGENLVNSISPLETRALSDWQLTDLIIASDIDGNLHGIERKTGASIWTLPINEPLVQISGNHSDEDAKSNLLWFVEPFEDGSLFYFSPGFGLNKLPTTIKNLVMESPFSLNGDDKIYTGTRKTSLFTLNKLTGEVTKQFGSQTNPEACPTSYKYHGLDKTSNDDTNHIMLGKTTYELSIHSKTDSNIVWNVTYSHWGPNKIDNDLMVQNSHSIDKLYFTPFHDKSLLALSHKSGAPAWMSKLPSMVVNVFDIFNHRTNGNCVAIPHPAKEFNQLQHIADGTDASLFDLCFLNKTTKSSQWFAMSYTNFPALIKSSPTSPYQMALQQYEKGFLDQSAIDKMRNLKVSGHEADFFIRGTHKYGSLTSSNFYQPGVKFGRDESKLIGDGSYELIKPTSWASGGVQPPSIIEGIFFPSPEEPVKNGVSIGREHQGLQDTHQQKKENLPIAYQKHNSPFDSLPVQNVSMLRRITEDLVVMFTLICFLMAFVKIAQKFKYLTPERSKIVDTVGDLRSSRPESNKADGSGISPMLETSSRDAVSFIGSFGESGSEGSDRTSQLEKSNGIEFSSGVSAIDGDETETSESVLKAEDNSDSQEPMSLSKKKRKRGSRGGKRGGRSKKSAPSDDEESPAPFQSEDTTGTITVDEGFGETVDDTVTPTISLVKTFAKPDNELKKLQIDNNLVISNKVLGYGSHGTVVYEGTFENRPVAVKRMLFDFYDIANHEVRLLQESDDHPNVIRYFCSQSNLKEKFLYIALELCVCSLEDSIEKSRLHSQKLRLDMSNRNDLLHQLASGLGYLHSLKIVHRDLKPQNILLGERSKKDRHLGKSSPRLLISDFGLCKKLDADQSSFGATMHNAASGTSGWRAPELLRPDEYPVSPHVPFLSEDVDHMTFAPIGNEKRLTKAIDIFSLGCVFFYILSDGYHPFGDRYLREANIIKGHSDLSMLVKRCPADYVEAIHLISSMIQNNPKHRPDTTAILKHPFFWNSGKKLEFLLKVSDRFEIEKRDPPSNLLLSLEKVSHKVHQGDWLSRFDSDFTENLGKYRKYHTEKVMDLLRALRNKYHHYNDMPSELQRQMSPLPVGFYSYFNQKFPHLLMEIYAVVEKHLQTEHMFHEFF